MLPDERSLMRLAMSPGVPPLRQLRARIGATLPRLAAALLADIELVATELVTNVYLHGEHPAEFQLRMPEVDRVRVEVFDSGSALPIVRHPDVRTLHGRGLLLVEAFSVRWGVTVRGAGKTVWAEFATG